MEFSLQLYGGLIAVFSGRFLESLPWSYNFGFCFSWSRPKEQSVGWNSKFFGVFSAVLGTTSRSPANKLPASMENFKKVDKGSQKINLRKKKKRICWHIFWCANLYHFYTISIISFYLEELLQRHRKKLSLWVVSFG